jgi:hypothetical protein
MVGITKQSPLEQSKGDKKRNMLRFRPAFACAESGTSLSTSDFLFLEWLFVADLILASIVACVREKFNAYQRSLPEIEMKLEAYNNSCSENVRLR